MSRSEALKQIDHYQSQSDEHYFNKAQFSDNHIHIKVIKINAILSMATQ